MKILHIIAQKPNKTGSGVYVSNIIKEFDKKNYKQAIIAGITEGEEIDIDTINNLEKYPVYFERENMPFPVVGMSDVMPYKSTRYKDLNYGKLTIWTKNFIKKIKKAVKEFDPDIIISHHLYLLTSIVREEIKDKKIIGVCHGTDLRQLNSIDLMNDFIKHKVKNLDAVLALHEEQKNQIIDSFKIDTEKVFVTGSGYDDRIFYNKKKTNKKDKKINLVYTGKISYSKGLIPLINAYSSLNYKSDEISLTLVGMGSGEEYKNILDLSRNCPLPIKFTGILSQKELSKVYEKCHIFILPSFYEGLPLVLIEALASGLSVITSEIKGIKEWMGNEINNSGRIKYISLPRLKDIDIPYEEDLPKYEKELRISINEMIRNIRNNEINKNVNTSHLSWNGLTDKIENIINRVNDSEIAV